MFQYKRKIKRVISKIISSVKILYSYILTLKTSKIIYNRETMSGFCISGLPNNVCIEDVKASLESPILKNAELHNITPSHDESGQAMHPSVIDFKTEFEKDSWAGYRYWMAMTPYTNHNDGEEDPNLLASIDGINWVVPAGIINPLDKVLKEKGYNADTEMIYNTDTNELYIYYRTYYSNLRKLELRLIKVTEEMKYSKPIILISLDDYNQIEDKFRSLCIYRESSTKWHMWGNGGNVVGSKKLTFWYSFSDNGIDWGEFKQVLNKDNSDPFLSLGYENWHSSCKPYSHNSTVYFLSYCRPLFFVLGFSVKTKSVIFEHYKNSGLLLLAECDISSPLLLNISTTRPILTKGLKRSWDGFGLYRSTFTIDRYNGKIRINVWYSGEDKSRSYHIGYTSGFIKEA